MDSGRADKRCSLRVTNSKAFRGRNLEHFKTVVFMGSTPISGNTEGLSQYKPVITSLCL